jgi:hypothetical protein
MRRRHSLVAAAMAFVACGVACVDLFHSTDFETLCNVSPTDPRCGTDAAVAGDVVSEVPAVDARPPHPDFCSWSSTRAETAATRACAWLGACEGALGESAFGKCVARAQLAFDCKANPKLRPAGATDDFWSCLATATTCKQVDDCAFPSGQVDACREFASGSFTSCGNANPTTHVKCAAPGGGRPVGVEPCAMLGKTCSITDSLGSTATCSGTVTSFSPGATACVENACRGTIARNCTGGGTSTTDDGFDCASQSAKCTLAAGVPACTLAAGAACTPDAPPSCDGARVIACVDGHQVAVDCAVIGLECDIARLTGADLFDLTAACALATPTCTGADRCDGTQLTSCGRGQEYKVDCVSVGLAGCDATKGACTAP